MAYGDVYEVVDETLAQPVYSNQPTSRNVPKPKKHPTTRGYGYKRLNEPDSEVMVDIFGELVASMDFAVADCARCGRAAIS
jgi:hypothetical protein